MKQLVRTTMSKKEAVAYCGGYTCVNQINYVVSDLNMNPEHYDSVIVTGIEYGSNGESLNLTESQVKAVIIDIMGNVSSQKGKGGYTNKEGELVEETCLVIDGSSFNDAMLSVMAERVRVALRQEAVLLVLSTSECLILEG